MNVYPKPESKNAPFSTEIDACQRAQEVLLNCYCREVAGPEGHLCVGPLFGQNDWPMSLRMILSHGGGQAMHVLLPHTCGRLLTVVSHASATGNYRYQSALFHKSPGQPWKLLDWESAATLLLNELSLKYELPANAELMDQIRNSVAVTARLLSAASADPLPEDPIRAYVHSEQSLTFGHPFHPAPKSRQGFSSDDIARYSPEMRVSFPLHYFAVRHEDITQQSLLERECQRIVAERGPDTEPGFSAVPVHPWQAAYLLGLPLVRQAVASGRMRYLGEHGKDFYPTSSIRTLYQPGNPYFYKFSLNVRITNCVRKNAWYELESAMQVTRLLRPLLSALYRQFEGIRVLEEPAFMSVDFHDRDAGLNREVVEGFGMILRQGLDGMLATGARPVLAGALFGDHLYGEARLHHMLQETAHLKNASVNSVAERWFYEYVERLMYPVFHLFFVHGVIFEPHLQNVVIGIRDGVPTQIFLRDFEGVKLVSERYREGHLPGISHKAHESLCYGDDQGWNRISYCLFVNNFCEAIDHLAAERPALQRRLWAIVRHHMQRYQSRFGNFASARRVNALLGGQPLPGKANLINRFFKRPDRGATYVPVTNPMATASEAVAWN